jgi:hypothetical protein
MAALSDECSAFYCMKTGIEHQSVILLCVGTDLAMGRYSVLPSAYKQDSETRKTRELESHWLVKPYKKKGLTKE